MPKASTQSRPRQDQPRESESPPPVRGIDGFFRRRELAIILALCLLACIRVLVFSAAFPMFNNVDEPSHYDVVCKYALGEIPTGLESFSLESARVLGWHSTPEYLTSQEEYDLGEVRPPLKDLPPAWAQAFADQSTNYYMSLTNNESTQPPVYYAAAGIWYKLGELFGLSDIRLAYWIRFLNVLVYGLMVWTAYVLIRRLYPGNLLLRMGVPLLLAFFPQDVFYQISNDVLTPILFAAAFYFLLRIYQEENRSWGFHIIAGLAVAAVFLVKISNITIFLPLALVLFTLLKRARSEGRLREALPRLGVMLSAAVIPIALWMARNYNEIGDLLGTADKTSRLGWAYKPLAEIFDHPVFTPEGAYTFVSGLIATFWRGEIVWHLVRIARPASDIFYTVSTLLFVGAAVAALIRKRERKPAHERYAGWLSVSVLAASVMVMTVLSLIFDFGYCFYPSPEHPYLTSGRLMSGVLIPFLVLYVTGLDFLMARARLRFSRLSVLLAIVVLITACEIALNLKVFHSPYNWFHL